MFVLYVAHAVNTGGSSLFRSIHACENISIICMKAKELGSSCKESDRHAFRCVSRSG